MVADRPPEVSVRQHSGQGGPCSPSSCEGPPAPWAMVRLAQPVASSSAPSGSGSTLPASTRLAKGDERFEALAERFVGMRPPYFPSVFEAVVNAIACQQLSLAVGIHLL